ncbi:PREDICTED: TNFAIP3-interacting protein 1-like [Branchiostoma belcheri]|uniref:TNFAIP3-interacting protein 1-like n=1 Tax=Branchiostoma belcheri TaxID=7741 RepID=A0A6P4YB16_BRABE|nr:PREDICTED: TNFAIP3-interacting protein 1-like [Branchiostoma belcheri]
MATETKPTLPPGTDPPPPSYDPEAQRLREENERLCEENERLLSRVQGVQVLGEILHDTKCEANGLRNQVDELRSKLSLRSNGSESSDEHTPETPTDTKAETTGDLDTRTTQEEAVKEESVEDTETKEEPVAEETDPNQEFVFVSSESSELTTMSSKGTLSWEPELRPDITAQLREDSPVLSRQVLDLEAALGAGSDRSGVAGTLARFAVDVMRRERAYNIQEALIQSMSEENERLKAEFAATQDGKDALIVELRKQSEDLKALNSLLKQEVNQLQAAQDSLGRGFSPIEMVTSADLSESTTQPLERDQPKMCAVPVKSSASPDDQALRKRIEELEGQKKEILEVNKQWDVQYKAMKADMGQKMRDIETRHEETMRKNAELVNAEEKRQRDIDGMLMSAKKRIEAEERAKDKALLDLQQEKQRGDTLSARVTLLENQITDMMRQRGNQEAEIRRLNEALGEASSIAVLSPPALQPAERQQAPARPAQPPSHPAQPQSAEPLRTEVEVLRAQVATFREDFEMERRDRERMQGEKDTLKDEITALRMHVDTLSQQARVYEEDFRRERSDKERLQRQLGHMPQGAGQGHHYNIPPPQRHVPPPKLYRPQAPPPYREDPPAYQNYPHGQTHPPPTPHELQQREFDRYRQYGRLIPRQYPRTLGHDVVDDGTPRDEPLEDHVKTYSQW